MNATFRNVVGIETNISSPIMMPILTRAQLLAGSSYILVLLCIMLGAITINECDAFATQIYHYQKQNWQIL